MMYTATKLCDEKSRVAGWVNKSDLESGSHDDKGSLTLTKYFLAMLTAWLWE